MFFPASGGPATRLVLAARKLDFDSLSAIPDLRSGEAGDRFIIHMASRSELEFSRPAYMRAVLSISIRRNIFSRIRRRIAGFKCPL